MASSRVGGGPTRADHAETWNGVLELPGNLRTRGLGWMAESMGIPPPTQPKVGVAGERIGILRIGLMAVTKRAGLTSDLVQHDLRHRRVTTWQEVGKPVHCIQKAMGHSDIKTTLGY